MEFLCENCGSPFDVPDERLASVERIVVRCMNCGKVLKMEVIEADPSHGAAQEARDALRFEARRPAQERLAEEDLEYFEEDAKLSLIMENDAQQVEMVRQAVEDMGYTYIAAESTREALDTMRYHHMMEHDAQRIEMLRQAVVDLGYTYVTAENTREAIGKLRFHHFDLLVLSDRFDGIELEQSPIAHYLNHLPMSIRRRIFLAIIGDDFRTMDQLTAFAWSANLVVARQDLQRLSVVLQQAMMSHNKFYKVLKDTLAELGRA